MAPRSGLVGEVEGREERSAARAAWAGSGWTGRSGRSAAEMTSACHAVSVGGREERRWESGASAGRARVGVSRHERRRGRMCGSSVVALRKETEVGDESVARRERVDGVALGGRGGRSGLSVEGVSSDSIVESWRGERWLSTQCQDSQVDVVGCWMF